MPKISVLILTYNHEMWIDAAIESVVSQSVADEIEIIIHDDCSTDGTTSKVMQWREKFPHQIRVILPEESFGKRNLLPQRFASLINEETRGTYLHILEGDDYWGDKDKVRKQAAFLDANPEFAMCFHNVNLVSEDGAFLSELIPLARRVDFRAEDLRRFNYSYLHLSALCFRNFKPQMPGEYFLGLNGDMFFPFAYGARGGAKFLGDISASSYRQTRRGVWANLSTAQKAINKLQLGLLMASCLITAGDIKSALGQLTARIVPEGNNVYAAISKKEPPQ